MSRKILGGVAHEITRILCAIEQGDPEGGPTPRRANTAKPSPTSPRPFSSIRGLRRLARWAPCSNWQTVRR